jgi:hypothetical protein
MKYLLLYLTMLLIITPNIQVQATNISTTIKGRQLYSKQISTLTTLNKTLIGNNYSDYQKYYLEIDKNFQQLENKNSLQAKCLKTILNNKLTKKQFSKPISYELELFTLIESLVNETTDLPLKNKKRTTSIIEILNKLTEKNFINKKDLKKTWFLMYKIQDYAKLTKNEIYKNFFLNYVAFHESCIDKKVLLSELPFLQEHPGCFISKIGTDLLFIDNQIIINDLKKHHPEFKQYNNCIPLIQNVMLKSKLKYALENIRKLEKKYSTQELQPLYITTAQRTLQLNILNTQTGKYKNEIIIVKHSPFKNYQLFVGPGNYPITTFKTVNDLKMIDHDKKHFISTLIAKNNTTVNDFKQNILNNIKAFTPLNKKTLNKENLFWKIKAIEILLLTEQHLDL